MYSLYALFLSTIRDKVTCACKLFTSLRSLVLVALLLFSAACDAKATFPSTPYSTETTSTLQNAPSKTLSPSVKSDQLADHELLEQKPASTRLAENLIETPQASIPRLSTTSGTPLPHPEQTSDLLFIAGGDLMRWDYVTGFYSSLVVNVAEFSASANGKRVAVLRPKMIAANGIELFDLSLLDFETMQLTILLEETPRLYHMAISPDGNYIAYTTNQQSGLIYALPTEDPVRPLELGKCHLEQETTCQDFTWSPDSEEFIWSDALGVWNSAPGWTAPNLVHSGKLEVSDPQGKKSIIDVKLQALKWSPTGRYVLTTVTPTASDVNWHAILDTLTGRLIEVPDSFETQAANANASWSPNGDLFTAQTSSSLETSSPAINVWHVLATHDSLLIPSQKIALNPGNITFSAPQNEIDTMLCLKWLAAHGTDALMLGATLSETNNPPILLQLNLVDGKFNELIEVPFQAKDILWSPDGAGALVIDMAGQIFFVHASSSSLYNLSLVFGEDAHQFIWLPPAPRS